MTPSNQNSDEAPKPRTKYREPWYLSNEFSDDEQWCITDGVETFPIHLASPAEFGLALQGTIERSHESTQQRLIEQVEYSIRLQRKLESLGYEAFGDFNLTSGRESKQHTDRETLAAELGHQLSHVVGRIRLDDSQGIEYDHNIWRNAIYKAADAILAAPSLSLVAARRDFAEKASAHMRANGHGFTRRIDMELLYDALFASGILKPSSEVEAAALEAAVEGASGTAAEAIRARAARVRSGKDE